MKGEGLQLTHQREVLWEESESSVTYAAGARMGRELGAFQAPWQPPVPVALLKQWESVTFSQGYLLFICPSISEGIEGTELGSLKRAL